MINESQYRIILNKLKSENVSLVAVSKFKPTVDIQALYDLGQRDFGENYVQELVAKQAQLPGDIKWHFIGHLQRNKVKEIAPFVHLIHSVDSFKLLQAINKYAAEQHRVISCLLQMQVTAESTKTGMTDKDLLEFMSFYQAQKDSLKNVRIAGMMGMATFTEDRELIRNDFKILKSIFDFAQKSYFLFDENFKELSMGMSGDFNLAIEEGSTMVRIGSLLFGERQSL